MYKITLNTSRTLTTTARRYVQSSLKPEHSWRPIRSILVANRGEIACRIMRTAKKMGIKSIAVYSTADSNSLHVKQSDEAYLIGPPEASLSYLNQEKILSIASQSGACAIHPGYGFLSENCDFAGKCKQSNVVWIGPPESAIYSMGIKSEAKSIMQAAGVPVVPGYHGSDQNDSFLLEQANSIGYPVLIKAIKGGGGKGMRISHSKDDFMEQLDSARRESAKAFGDDAVLIEKYIQSPRHVEVQVFGDQHGNYVHLFERDCSVQRRHQKVIEEAPGPGIDHETRERLGQAAKSAAAAVNYVGAGTVEFIYDPSDNQFYFMEMNTRLQVEHPITEMITGIDLVEWQIRVASGEPLPRSQEQIKLNGHAFEARVYAEDCDNSFMPCPGFLEKFIAPVSSEIRIETGVESGDTVSVFYDPMIAKIICWDTSRDTALGKLRSALAQTKITGVISNLPFLLRLANNEDFIQGKVNTDFISNHQSQLLAPVNVTNEHVSAVAYAIMHKMVKQRNNGLTNSFRVHDALYTREQIDLLHQGNKYSVVLQMVGLPQDGTFSLTINGNNGGFVSACHVDDATGEYTLLLSDQSGQVKRKKYTALETRDGSKVTLFTGDPEDSCIQFELPLPQYLLASGMGSATSSTGGAVVSPMPGVVDKVLVKVNDTVRAGDALAVLIAMKMEYTLKAASDGVVTSVNATPGQTVAKGVVLVTVEPEANN